MKNKRREHRWTYTLAPLLFGSVCAFLFIRSFLDEAIYRGLGLEPVITLSENPKDYYMTLALEGFLALISFIAVIFIARVLYAKDR